jgi:hypothetical protein
MHQYKSRHLFLLCLGQSKQIRRIWTIGNQPVLGAVSGLPEAAPTDPDTELRSYSQHDLSDLLV